MNLHCPFKKTLLSKDYSCSCASITHLPMGCNIVCKDDAACDECNTLMGQLIEAARFTLQYQPNTDSLTHGKLLRIQYGGLKGLAKLLPAGQAESVDLLQDIVKLVTYVRQYWGDYYSVPYAQILQDIATHQNRQRRSK